MNRFISLSADLNRLKIGSLGDIGFSEVGEALLKLKELPVVRESMIVQKCNCTELYALAKGSADGELTEDLMEFWEKNSADFRQEYRDLISVRLDEDAIRHLFETAVGLKSVTVGDAQVYGQIRKAFKISNECGASGPFLKTLQYHVKKLSKKIDDSTNFRRGKTSVPRVVADIIKDRCGNVNVLVVGLGKMGSLLAKVLSDMGYCVTITDLNESKSKSLSVKYGCSCRELKDLPKAIEESGVVVFATNKKHLINKGNLQEISSKSGSPVFVDIGNPPNIDPDLQNRIKIINMDAIGDYARRTHGNRLSASSKVNRLISDEVRKAEASLCVKSLFKELNSFGARESKKLLDRILSKGFFTKFTSGREFRKMGKDSDKLQYLLKKNISNTVFLEKFKYYVRQMGDENA